MARKIPKKRAKKSIKAQRKSNARGKAKNPKAQAKQIKGKLGVNPTIIRHQYNILKYTELNKWNIVNGMVVRFYHNTPGIHDNRPLVFVFDTDEFNVESKSRKFSGINLNYLPEAIVQKLFSRLSKRLTLTNSGVVSRARHDEFLRFDIKDEEDPAGIPPSVLYESTIKPLVISHYDSYRSYLYRNITRCELIDYRMNFRGMPSQDEEGRTIYEN